MEYLNISECCRFEKMKYFILCHKHLKNLLAATYCRYILYYTRRQFYLVHTNLSCIVRKSRNIFFIQRFIRKNEQSPTASMILEKLLSRFRTYFYSHCNLLYIHLQRSGLFCAEYMKTNVDIDFYCNTHIHACFNICVLARSMMCVYSIGSFKT